MLACDHCGVRIEPADKFSYRGRELCIRCVKQISNADLGYVDTPKYRKHAGSCSSAAKMIARSQRAFIEGRDCLPGQTDLFS
jgi:recombinational DNA repair protein (RecF pathway)